MSKHLTLAERYLRVGGVPMDALNPEKGAKVDEWIRTFLKPPDGSFLMANPFVHADRFVFDTAPDVVCSQMRKAGALTSSMLGANTRMPTNQVWFEVEEELGTTGVLGVRRNDQLMLTMVLDHRRRGRPVPLVQTTTSDFPWFQNGNGLMCDFNWLAYKELRTVLGTDVTSFFGSACFMLSIPRVCEVRKVMTPRKGPREVHLHPRVEYKMVTMKVGVGAPRYESQRPGESDESYKKRLHHVIGHFRTYRKNRETPRLSWVPPHWRGDSDLGVILHERKVST